jgi:penicillin-binding protein 2
MANRNLTERKVVIIAIFAVVGFIFLARLFYIQVLDESYILSAESNVLRKNTIYPNRGVIFDRNGKLLVYDEAAYDIMVVPRQVKVMDTLEFCRLVDITIEDFRTKIKKAISYSRYKPTIFISSISKKEFGYIEEKLYKFPGFFVQSRSLRTYPYPIAAHLMGYVAEVDNREIAADSYYKMGDYIGKSGIERFYEPVLRGKKGFSIVMVDVHNREQGHYKDGKYDTLAVLGQNLYLTIDAELQSYGERLMKNKIGSIVAIDPESGEILSFVSSPGYDPNLLVGRIKGENFSMLAADTLKPLINRAIMGAYPPGSTFKMANALVGLQMGVLNEGTAYSCSGPATSPIKCTHNHKSPLQLREAIEQSCNPYFWNVYKSILERSGFGSTEANYEKWRGHILSLGFGKKFNTDIPFETSGNIPTSDFFNRIYGVDHWRALTIRSLGIGQGEITVTPLQMANMAAIIANKGYYYPPHVVKATGSLENQNKEYNKKVYSTIDSVYYNVLQEAMLEVFEGAHGTARWAKIEGIKICGKTGTAQNPHGKDHSMFIAFAPLEDPKIALSVIVENAGFGSTWAAPIASLMIDKYLNDTISRPDVEQRILDADLIHTK